MEKLYTSAELAHALGISKTTIQDWKEKGLIEPLYTAGEYATGEHRIYLFDIKLVKKTQTWKDYRKWKKNHFRSGEKSRKSLIDTVNVVTVR